MSMPELILSFPVKDTKRIKKIFPESKTIYWLYLGQDFFKRRLIERGLGSRFIRIDIAKLLDEVANDIRYKHVEWIDDLNRRYGKSLEWWFGSISSRNIYYSSLFQNCCHLEILERTWGGNQEKKPSLIVIESLRLAKSIKKWALKRGIGVEIFNYSFLRNGVLICYLVLFLEWGKFIMKLLSRWIAAYITRSKYEPKDLKIEPSIIVDTYVHDDSLSDDGVFKDRYFPYLHEYLSEKGIQILVHPVLYGFRFNYYSIYKKMRQSKTLFIIQEDYLHFYDYLSALTYPLRLILHPKIEGYPFRNFDVSDLLKEDQVKQPIEQGIQAILIYRLFLRLGKRGLKPKQIIDWYENQVIDKALIAGTRKAFSQAKIIGAQMFIHPSNLLSLFPSQSEVEARVVPHILLETSEYQCKVAQSFTKDIPCQFVAALRYAYVFDENNATNRNQKEEQRTKIILILLSFNITEAIEVLEIINEGLDQINEDVRIIIKGHPDYNSKKLIQMFGEQNWPSRFEIFDGHLREALNLASVVVSSGSSSMIEAAAKGIPVIFLGRQTVLSYNILSNLDMNIVTKCFSIQELIAAINKYLNLSPVQTIEYRKMGRKVRDLFFTPVNEETMSPFLIYNYN